MSKKDASQNEVIREAGRVVAGAYYDFQSIRLSAMSRMRDVIRKVNLDIPFDKVEDKKEKKTYDKAYADKNLKPILKQLLDDGKINYVTWKYLDKILDTVAGAGKLEKKYTTLMMNYVKNEEIYTRFLSKIRGLGAVLSANLIKSFGYCDGIYKEDVVDDDGVMIHEKGEERCPHISSLWKICGMHVVDGKAPKRHKGQKVDFNPALRTMIWKISDSFIKQNTPVYKGIYDSEKERQLKRKYDKGELFEKYGKPYTKKDTKLKLGHAHNRAMRKMVKIFLQHYWVVGREIAGMPITKPYQFDKLKHTHYISYQDVLEAHEREKAK